MAASQPPRGRRPGTWIDRADDEPTLVGEESESDMSSDGIPRGLLEEPTALPERAPSDSPRSGTHFERHNGQVVLRGAESAEDVSEGVVVALSPYESDDGRGCP